MVLDPISMCARGCRPSKGLLHTTSAGTQKKCTFLTVGPVLRVHVHACIRMHEKYRTHDCTTSL